MRHDYPWHLDTEFAKMADSVFVHLAKGYITLRKARIDTLGRA
jgi:hypothetical protein